MFKLAVANVRYLSRTLKCYALLISTPAFAWEDTTALYLQ